MSNNPELVKIIIDGKEVQAPKGENLLKIILNQKVSIPYYCYHPGLSVAGACRMCMVEIEKQPRPTIACNTMVTEGMVVKTNTEKLKEIQRWNLAFHLINHPLDCPICDQAGECGLQDYYMKYGKYDSPMHEKKVLKRKVISIGEHVMLDTERCILCSRCVRFFDEVPKTSEMAIFKRGDASEIGTYMDQDLNNNYTLNSVDICPVGALTSKDFRFQKRVWFLKEVESVCPGCSTGCNVTVSQNAQERKNFRMRPRHNEAVNGYWMCDYGRMRYKQTHFENRIKTPMVRYQETMRLIEWSEATSIFKDYLKEAPHEIAVLITPQYTVEELQTIYDFFTKTIQTPHIYHTVDKDKATDQTVMDELLLRKDKNPNSQGLLSVSKKYGLEMKDLTQFLSTSKQSIFKVLCVFGPEDPESYPEFLTWFNHHSTSVILIGTQLAHTEGSNFSLILPTLTFTEKKGTFVNVQGREQKIHAGVKIVPDAKSVAEILC